MNKFLIYRFLIGIKKKNLFNVKYVSVYLMLNAVNKIRIKFINYKLITLLAELQGQIFKIFYSKKTYISIFKLHLILIFLKINV